jgi:hypothetical protein
MIRISAHPEAEKLVLAEKIKYEKDGKYLALITITGSLGNLSVDVYTFIELIAGIQTTSAVLWRNTSREQLFSIYRQYLGIIFRPVRGSPVSSSNSRPLSIRCRCNRPLLCAPQLRP